MKENYKNANKIIQILKKAGEKVLGVQFKMTFATNENVPVKIYILQIPIKKFFFSQKLSKDIFMHTFSWCLRRFI
jgi:hypothetical protein